MDTNEPLGPRLEIVSKGAVDQTLSLTDAPVRIGRDLGLEIRFEEPYVSRRHAQIERRGARSWYLTDSSRHGDTFLNGRRVGGLKPQPLRDGDKIGVADHVIVFRDALQFRSDDSDSNSHVIESLTDFSSRTLSESSTQPLKSFRAMLDVIMAVGGTGGLDDRLGRAVESLMAVFPHAESALLVTSDPDGRLPIRALRHRGGQSARSTLSRTILEQVLNSGEAVLIEDAVTDAQYGKNDSVTGSFCTALCVPLTGHNGKPLGMVQIAGQGGARTRPFNRADLEMLAALALPLAVTVENHRMVEERASWSAAREIQKALLPEEPPEIPGYTFWDCYVPAQQVGGDLYDYIRVDRGDQGDHPRLVVCVGDVAGKGMPAALLSAAVSPEVRHAVWAGEGPAEVLLRVNQFLCEGRLEARFVTMVLAEIDPLSHKLTLASAGHEHPLVRRTDGSVVSLQIPGTGPPLGVDSSAAYQSFSMPLLPGEVIVLHTDGLSDSQDTAGVRFGTERVARTVGTGPTGVSNVGETLLAAVTEHARNRSPFDDLTIVCFGREST